MRFRFSGVLLRFTGYQSEVEVAATTIPLGLAALGEKLPSLRGVLLDGSGKLRSAHRLFLNGVMVRNEELDQPVDPDGTVEVLTALAGG
jgi:hypothetical protein